MPHITERPVHAQTVVATVAVGNGPYGVAVNPSTNLIYVTNVLDNTVSVISDPGLPPTAESPWPMFQHDIQHTGRSPFAGPETATPKWIFSTGGYIGASSPPVIGVGDIVFIHSSDGKLYAINPDGSLKWSFTTGGSTNPAPAIALDGTIYVPSGRDLFALNQDGSLKWKYTTAANNFLAPPTIGGDGTIYVSGVGNWPGELWAINPDGSLKWSSYGLWYGPGGLSSPAIAPDGTIYVGSTGYDGYYLYAFDPEGNNLWKFGTGDHVTSSPSIGFDGTIYIGSTDGKFYAVNPNGTRKWMFSIGSIIQCSPAIGRDGTIYVSSSDGNLYAINPNGTLQWTLSLGLPYTEEYQSPVIDANGTIYIGSGWGNLYAVNADGVLKLTFPTGSIHSSSAIGADGTIYVGSIDKKLYAFGPGADITPPAKVTDLTVAEVTSNSVTLTWTAPGDDGNVGTASQYDIRYSISSITETNWDSATQCTGVPYPQPAGSSENFTVTGLSAGATCYFALKTSDEAGNESGLSNVISGTTYLVSKRRPVLLVHGFQRTVFDPVEIWTTMAEILTGNNIDNKQQILNSDHDWYKLSNKTEDDFLVYISNYSHYTNSPTFTDIRCYAQNLAQEIEKIKEETGCDKVDIVAHSMGGLVARTYIENSDFSGDTCPTKYDNDVGKLIMLGTPNHGLTLGILGTLLEAAECFRAPNPDQPNRLETCLRTEHFVSGAQMLPVPPVTIIRWGSFLNTLNKGVTGHQIGVDYTTVAGNLYSCGSTYKQSILSWFLEEVYTRIITLLHGGCNDGLVTANSVELPGVESHTLELDHTGLRACPAACMTVKQMLLAKAMYFERTHILSFACPVHVVVTDEYGRSISDDGMNSIPGAYVSIDEITEVISFYLPPNLSYTIYVTGYDSGDFSVMEELPISDKDTLINRFRNIDVTDKTNITFDMIDGDTSRLLKIDYDGNGTVEMERNLDVATIVSTRTYPINTATGSGVVTFQSDGGIISGLTALDAFSLPSAGKPNVSFPHGLFSFNITDLVPGSTVTVTITLPSPAPVGTEYWKYQNGRWHQMSIGDDDGDNVITIELTDGSQFDADGQVNGTIVDPSGPAVAPAPASAPSAPQASPTPPRLLNPAQMSVKYLSINPQQTSAGQPVTITTNVVNNGDEAGNYNALLKINGQVEQTKMVSVGPQGTQPVKFTVAKSQPGTYTVGIAGQKGSFTVLGAYSSASGASTVGGLIAILIVGLLIIAVVILFRRRAY
ncbi:MAG: PQQ-binding-like beta-propeller repeat protein [Dehalococcoidia bacterium]|nr:PQQ-binding-like beta-propeller repeat protein [Dehalococcoidia bacterium]